MKIPKKKVFLKTKRLKSYWLTKKEVKDFPKSLKSGDFIDIFSKDGDFLATGYANPESKIFIRVISLKNDDITQQFIFQRIKEAFDKRKELLTITDSVRIVHSEGDFLPGLIVDKYKDVIVIQINTAGMESLRHFILFSIKELFNPVAIYEKSDEKMREKEGLLHSEGLILGKNVREVIINENNVKFFVNFEKSQKTGFYLDQRCNRKILSKFSKEKKVLDLFANTGGFGIYCALNNAKSVKFVEISKEVVDNLRRNIELNKIENYSIVNDNVFSFIQNEKDKFDIIIIDPPSFTKSKKEKKDALKGYKYLLKKSYEILNNSGVIAIFSCSHYIEIKDLFEICNDINLQVIKILIQDIDHPVLSSIPTTFYLKGLILKKL